MDQTTVPSIGEIVRKAENDYTHGTTQISEYVNYSMHETIETIYAYIHSKHISGEYDSLGREKPFFNIVVAAANIWMRATDIDRKNIKVRATKSKDWVDAFLATVLLQEWMRKEGFGKFLNKWGRILSRYGSCIVKTVRNSKGLHIKAMAWSRMIVDAVEFGPNVRIELLDLTQAELYKRITTHGYNAEQVRALCFALQTRETVDKKRKDNKTGYIRLYELHGVLPKSNLTDNPRDNDVYVQQMHIISYVEKRVGRKTQYDDFTIFRGPEEKDPYRITHLIEEYDRTLSIGAVEHLFQSQWMQNHTAKNIKDQLDIASRLVFQTADPRFVGQNILTDLEQGSIFVHEMNAPLNQLNNGSHDITSQQNFAVQWKNIGNEITGVSEAMLGAQPKSGTAWRQTEALLDENYSLFELMTENKGLYLEDILREDVIPFLKETELNSSKEIAAILDANDIERIDARYIKNISLREAKKEIKKKILEGEPVTPEEQELMIAKTEADLREALNMLGDKRFFKPSNISDKTWKEQLKNLEWELEFDITGEQRNVQEMLTTLNTALSLVVQPGFEQNKKAQSIVGRILELTGAMSPIEYNAIPSAEPPQQENEQPQLQVAQ